MYKTIGIVGVGKIGSVFRKILEDNHIETVCIDKRFDMDYSKLSSCEIVFVLVDTVRQDAYFTDNIIDVLDNCKFLSVPIVVSSTCDPAFFKLKQFESIIYHPFFVTQSSIEYDILHPYFAIVGGDADPVRMLYLQLGICTDFYEMSLMEAALVKTGFNAFLTMKLALANLIGDLCCKENADPDVVLEAIGAAEPVNSKYFRYGFGYGGPCLPIDNDLFQKTLKSAGIDCNLPTVVEGCNRQHLSFQIEQFKATADKSVVHSLKQVAYKAGTGMLEHSQQLEFAKHLALAGYKIKIEDKSVADKVKQLYGDLFLY